MDCIGAVYALEAEVKAKGLAPEERLRLHVQRSEPAMEALREYCQGLIESKEVEPNSGLGQAIGYMTKRWEEITQFYRIAGAPLDNNISYAARGIRNVMPTAGLCRVAEVNCGFSA